MAASASLVWFRHDLRITDNPALEAAVQRRWAGHPGLPLGTRGRGCMVTRGGITLVVASVPHESGCAFAKA